MIVTNDYDFTYCQLAGLFKRITTSGSTREGFKSYWLVEEGEFTTEQVEEFAIAFYTAYNKMFPGTF
jgi:hypothetical protein